MNFWMFLLKVPAWADIRWTNPSAAGTNPSAAGTIVIIELSRRLKPHREGMVLQVACSNNNNSACFLGNRMAVFQVQQHPTHQSILVLQTWRITRGSLVKCQHPSPSLSLRNFTFGYKISEKGSAAYPWVNNFCTLKVLVDFISVICWWINGNVQELKSACCVLQQFCSCLFLSLASSPNQPTLKIFKSALPSIISFLFNDGPASQSFHN